MSSAKDIRRYVELAKAAEYIFEGDFINNYANTLSVDIESYELARLLYRFRAEKYRESEFGENSIIIPYSDTERKEFEEFLRSQGVSFKEMGKETNRDYTKADNTSPIAGRMRPKSSE